MMWRKKWKQNFMISHREDAINFLTIYFPPKRFIEFSLDVRYEN